MSYEAAAFIVYGYEDHEIDQNVFARKLEGELHAGHEVQCIRTWDSGENYYGFVLGEVRGANGAYIAPDTFNPSLLAKLDEFYKSKKCTRDMAPSLYLVAQYL